MEVKIKCKCKHCGKTFERDGSVTRVKCPHCGKENVYYPVQVGNVRFWHM